MHTFIAHLSQSVFHFNRNLLLAGALLAAASTITSCAKQNNPQDAATATAEKDSIEARQMAKEEAFLAQKTRCTVTRWWTPLQGASRWKGCTTHFHQYGDRGL